MPHDGKSIQDQEEVRKEVYASEEEDIGYRYQKDWSKWGRRKNEKWKIKL